MRILLGTSCHTVRDGADNFGEPQREKFLREINKIVQGSEHDLLYEFHIVICNVFTARKLTQYIPK